MRISGNTRPARYRSQNVMPVGKGIAHCWEAAGVFSTDRGWSAQPKLLVSTTEGSQPRFGNGLDRKCRTMPDVKFGRFSVKDHGYGWRTCREMGVGYRYNP